MKGVSLLAVSAVLVLSSTHTMAAGFCGSGLITHIKEGFWNNEGFVIHIDDSIAAPTVGSMHSGKWVRFHNTLNADRYRGIKALAYMAFSSGMYVTAFTSGSSCDGADELTIFLDPSSPDPS